MTMAQATIAQRAVSLFQHQLQRAGDAQQVLRAASYAAGLSEGLRLAGTLTAEQASDFTLDCDFEAARKCEAIAALPARPVKAEPTNMLPGLRRALNAIHAGMSGEQARATLHTLIADQMHADALAAASAAQATRAQRSEASQC